MNLPLRSPATLTAPDLVALFRTARCDLTREKQTQADLFAHLIRHLPGHADAITREHRLSDKDIPDIWAPGIAIEVKLKGARKMDVYRQLERYAAHDSVDALILISNLSMGLPPEINGKPAYFVALGRAWL